MFLAENLTDFYPDLLDRRFVSRFAIYHQRYSTNTFPTWRLAQPFRMLAHNGEINTISGNVNWMQSHETRLSDPALDPYIEDIKPVIQAGSSDTAALDAAFELLVRAGRDAPMAKALLIPASISVDASMKQAHKDLFLYCNAVMEPWDGPAAVAATDGRWMLAGLDRNGLRPLRYSLTHTGLLVVGSEAGMVKFDERDVRAKGRVGAGPVDRRRSRHREVLRRRGDQGLPRRPARLRRLDPAHHLHRQHRQDRRAGSQPAQRRVCCAAASSPSGMTLEELEMILHPMVEDAAEAVGSMGDDTPVAVLSERYRGLHHYFRQAFSQVTNPPIDSLRETRRDVAQDPARQPRQRAGRERRAVRPAAAGKARCCPTPSSPPCAGSWARTPA